MKYRMKIKIMHIQSMIYEIEFIYYNSIKHEPSTRDIRRLHSNDLMSHLHPMPAQQPQVPVWLLLRPKKIKLRVTFGDYL